MSKPYLVVIGGATASGKTAAAIELCKRINGEVVSCDSMQIYRGMDIGTAKPTLDEMDGIPHHMIDIVDPTESCSAAIFRDQANCVIADILKRGKQPVLCGGTGLYIDAITKPMAFSEQSDFSVREELKALSEQENGKNMLFDMLKEVDPESAQRLHPNDVRRVVRALEIYRLTGHTMTEQMKIDAQREGDYRLSFFALDWDRDQLYKRIDRRVLKMIEDGLVDEVKRLIEGGLSSESTAMQALGYKEIVAALDNRCTMDEAIEAIQTGSRHYAKRQLTWFKRDSRVRWIKADGRGTVEIVDDIMKEITNGD